MVFSRRPILLIHMSGWLNNSWYLNGFFPKTNNSFNTAVITTKCAFVNGRQAYKKLHSYIFLSVLLNRGYHLNKNILTLSKRGVDADSEDRQCQTPKQGRAAHRCATDRVLQHYSALKNRGWTWNKNTSNDPKILNIKKRGGKQCVCSLERLQNNILQMRGAPASWIHSPNIKTSWNGFNNDLLWRGEKY